MAELKFFSKLEVPVKRSLSIVAVGLLAAAGCSNSSKPATSSLQPTPAVTAVQPAPVQQAAYTTPQNYAPAPVDTSTPVAMGSEVSVGSGASYGSATTGMGGGTYTVKAGDTLYRIATTHYGAGKDWKKIAAANPGVNPNKLRVGQVLTLP